MIEKLKKFVESIRNPSFFHFFNKLCIRAFLPKRKKIFFSFAEKIVNKKLSLENLLEISIKFKILINLLLDEEQAKQLKKIPLFNMSDHLNENYKI